MRVVIQHRSRYPYPRPARLGPQLIRLRPADHARAVVERYRLEIEPEHLLHWQRDPHGNHVARVTVPLRAVAGRDVRVGGVRFRAWCPPHALHPHLGIHHPLRIDVCDTWGKRAVAGAAYHVWHPEGRAFDAPPLTRVEAEARRIRRFTKEGPAPWPLQIRPAAPDLEQPYTLDLRRIDPGSPMPDPQEWGERGEP